jgi:hypothetical protein
MRAVDYIRKGWAQGHYTVNDKGEPCDVLDPNACRWCAVGAIYAVSETMSDYWSAINKLKNFLDIDTRGGIDVWNDAPERTQAEVIEAMEKADI